MRKVADDRNVAGQTITTQIAIRATIVVGTKKWYRRRFRTCRYSLTDLNSVSSPAVMISVRLISVLLTASIRLVPAGSLRRRYVKVNVRFGVLTGR